MVVIVGLFGLWFVNRGPTVPYDKLKADWATTHSHYADLGNGVIVHYREDGPADAPVLILVHGYGDSHFTWEGWTPIVSQHYRTLAIDLPGHGLTEAPKTYLLKPANLADLVVQVADKIGVQKFSIAGNSLGGSVAWQTAVRHPDRVQNLILVDAGGWPSPPATTKPSLAFQIIGSPLGREFLKHVDNKPLIRQGVRGEVGDPKVITDAFIDRWAVLQRGPGHRDILLNADLSGVASATPELIGSIKAPTLILWGDVDPLINKASAAEFGKYISDSKVIIYPKVGHLPQVEIPQQSAGDAVAFLDAHLTKPPEPTT
ncbi:MAG: alpha/beta hydrolase [Asticcacaulis sp.]